MKTKLILIVAACLALTGCSTPGKKTFKLPNISGESVTYSRTDPFGGTQIEATNVKVTDETVTAETASWNTTYPAFTVKLTVKGYRRERTPEEKEEIAKP